MADWLLDNQSAPGTGSAGQSVVWVDSVAKTLCVKDDAGRVSAYTGNASVTAMAAGFAVDTYLTNSDLIIPSCGLQTKAKFFWQMSASKTNAGVAGPIYVVRIGTGKATTDTARLTLTGPAQTAVVDIGTLNIMVVVRVAGAACVIAGSAWWNHRGTAANTTTSGTGFANDSTGHIEGTSAAFDASALVGQYIGISINGGLNAVWTPTIVTAEASW